MGWRSTSPRVPTPSPCIAPTMYSCNRRRWRRSAPTSGGRPENGDHTVEPWPARSPGVSPPPKLSNEACASQPLFRLLPLNLDSLLDRNPRHQGSRPLSLLCVSTQRSWRGPNSQAWIGLAGPGRRDRTSRRRSHQGAAQTSKRAQPIASNRSSSIAKSSAPWFRELRCRRTDWSSR
jgi:hypothetical protein